MFKSFNKKQKRAFIQIIAAVILIVIAEIIMNTVAKDFKYKEQLKFILFMIPYLVVGFDILRKAVKGIANKQVFDENFLMAVATVGAIIMGEYVEGCAVMLFYQIGELFQSVAVGKSRKNISDLMEIRPDYANLEGECDANGERSIEKVDPDEVEVGSIIVVYPGEKIPIDGIIIEGSSSLNTAALTGESVPRSVSVGTEVISGSVNLSSVIRIETTKEFDESTASKILELVENASSRKSVPENFITKFAKVYTPAVCYLALALAVIPSLLNVFAGIGPEPKAWIYRALTFLVISCPCALVISIPLTFFAGLGCASHEGVLIKGSNYVESLSKAKIVVLDKTGTVTEGVFEVTDVETYGSFSREELIAYAAAIEGVSSHPIAKSIVSAYENNSSLDIKAEQTSIKEIAGHGIEGIVAGKKVACGNAKLLREAGIDAPKIETIGTICYVLIDNKLCGTIIISDKIKKTSKDAIDRLKKIGVKRSIMLTGDAGDVAEKVSSMVGIDEYHAELLPQDKVEKVEEIMNSKNENDKLIFVGDGINDAPVLSRADIGVAMGALGSDAAIEAADVVLMNDDPLMISKAIKIARKCIRIVYENIYFAIGIKVLCLILGALGIANMWLAIFADVGVMVLAVINAIRALRV